MILHWYSVFSYKEQGKMIHSQNYKSEKYRFLHLHRRHINMYYYHYLSILIICVNENFFVVNIMRRREVMTVIQENFGELFLWDFSNVVFQFNVNAKRRLKCSTCRV